MKLSVVIPAYNAVPWIKDAVDSVLVQDFRDWELIIVDDGSTDATPALIDRIAAGDSRISALHQLNAGPGVARNAGIDRAKGDYLLFLDSDDELASPAVLSSMVERAVNTGCDVLLARAREIGLHGEPGGELGWCLRKDLLPARDVFSPNDVGFSLFFLAGPVPWGKFYRREFVIRERLRFPPLARSEDFPFVQTAVACSEKIAVFDGVMVLHRSGRVDSLESTKDSTPLIFAEAEQIFFKMLEERGIWQRFSIAAKARALLRLSYNVEKMRTVEAVDEVSAQVATLLDRYRLPTGFREIPEVARVLMRLNAMARTNRGAGTARTFCDIISGMPKVSIIMPVYNVENYLRRCLDSVVGQTLRDMEIICVDDGSTDGSAEILREYAARDGRVKVLLHEHTNGGAARNAGMAVATGEYLGFVDSDDWCEPTLFERAYGKAKADDADVVFWGYRARDDSDGKVLREHSPALPSGVCVPFNGQALKEKIFSNFGYAPWNRLVRADLVRRNGLEFQQIERSNDVGFGCLALAVAPRISVVHEFLYNYSVRADGNLQSDNHRTPLSIVEAWSFLARELARRGLLEKHRRGVALASMYCFTRTLDVLSEHEGAYAVLFDALKALFERDDFFATVQPAEISNDIMANALKMIRASDTYSAFALRQASDVGKWMVKFYRDREQLKVRQSLPGVSLVVVSEGEGRSLERFEEHVEKASVADREIIYANDISEAMLNGVVKEYVAIVRDNDRYINDYALEVLVNTAKYGQADVAGGMQDDASVHVADFVFRSEWLRANCDLLDMLKSDEQAFIAAALARAGKQIVRRRVYAERLPPETPPLVSVVVPAHNAEQGLDRCMKSLVEQTHRNLEIIVVDDGSTDSTGRLSDAWAAKDGRIRVIHRRNGGLNAARNAGMKVAHGKYVGFANARDYMDPDMFGNMVEVLEGRPSCDVVTGGLAAEQACDAHHAFETVAETDVRPENKLYRVRFLVDNGIWFPEEVLADDEAFFFSVFCRARNWQEAPGLHYHFQRDDGGTVAEQGKAADKDEVLAGAKVFAFVAELLARENRRDLLGVLYRHMVDFVRRFHGTPLEGVACDRVAEVLHGTHAFYYADLISGHERLAVQRRVYELMNRMRPEGLSHVEVPNEWFPSALPPVSSAREHPVVSFVVPVYNAEKYIAVALETLRRQTLTDFEVICVDDGSIDDSGEILDFYSRVDPRIKVWHLENGGVSRARNFGLAQACGRYVAFFDGDDRLWPQMAARTVLMAACGDLDAVLFDFSCFTYDSLAPVGHYWSLAKHIGDFPRGRAFSPAELDTLSVYGSSCVFLWNREFLKGTGAAFADLRLGEDFAWVLSVLSKVRRMRVLNVPFYEYRRGNPTSAVSRLQASESEAPVLALKGLVAVLREVEDSKLRTLFLGRMVKDVIFYGEKTPKACAWLQEEGFEALGGLDCLKQVCAREDSARLTSLAAAKPENTKPDIEHFIRQAPFGIRRIMRRAIEDRKGCVKDLIIVAGQLNSTSNEPIDSWTFFRWLQDHGVPSRYVVWRKHVMIGKMREDNGLKDVILLSGNGVDNYEFIKKCRDVLPRVRAVVMENMALNQLTWRFFHMLDDCSYIFLQHGPTFWKMAQNNARTFSMANYINVASEAEKAFLEQYVTAHWDTGREPGYIIAGLPRWDLLKDESGAEREKVVFYMPTWRAMFNSGMDAMAKSAYFAGVKSLVSAENVARLKRRNLRLVMAAHHHLVNHVKGLDFELPIELVKTSEISYWIRHASICVTDYSSVCFDFLFLDKPCVFWTPDRHDGLLEGNGYSEVVFAEHQGVNMFNRVRSVEDVIEMVERYADSGFALEPEKRAIADRFFAYRANVCQHLYDQICSIDGKGVGA